MSIKSPEKKFPIYYPESIVPKEAYNNNKSIIVYRVCKEGKVEEREFIDSFNEYYLSKGIEIKGIDDIIKNCKDPKGLFAMSCYADISGAKYRLKFFAQRYPAPIIAEGHIDIAYGPWQRSCARKEKKIKNKHEKHHVDWWLYEGMNPVNLFSVFQEV